MATVKKAKVASSKGAKKKYNYEGKPIKPCVFLSQGKRMICAEYETGGLVLDSNKKALPWAEIVVKATITQ